MTNVIVLSGPIGAGKSSFAEALAKRYPIRKVSTREYIVSLKGTNRDRATLQAAGEQLDRETGGAWVAEAAALTAKDCPTGTLLLVDSARMAGQAKALRAMFGKADVLHVHLTAPDDVLEDRYLKRPAEMREFPTYREVRNSQTEAAVEQLALIADVVVDTTKSSPDSLVAYAMTGRVASTSHLSPLVDIFVGGQWGSEGKGNICAFVAHEYDVLVRVGGPNAGHRVADPAYKYVQIPSGTGSNPSAKVLIAAGSTIWVPTILKEIEDHPWLREPGRLVIDSQAMIIDQEDRDVETSLLSSIASTMQGVGSAAARKIIGRGVKPPFGSPVALARNETALAPFIGDVRAELDAAYARNQRVMLEGTQGTDLSLHHGFYPKVTSRETSSSGCLSDAGIAPCRVRKVVMVTRTYPIRVGGDSGPMGVEISLEEVAKRSGLPSQDVVGTEVGTVSGRKRRIAEFDWDQLRRSAELNGATDVALTFADYLGAANRDAKTFEDLLDGTKTFIRDVERVSNRPVSLVSTRFAKDGVIDRRNW